jgi:type II restriction enzyme
MSKLTEAQQILDAFGLPKKQQNERSALALLALCNLKETDNWKNAEKISMAVVGNKDHPKYAGIMRFIAEHYKKQYAENSREKIRRQTLHQFVQASIVIHNPENPLLPTNSKDNHYGLTNEALKVIRAYGTKKWKEEVNSFNDKIGSIQKKYLQNRNLHLIPVILSNGKKLKFSPGKHNQVQIAIIKEFAARFAPGSKLLYVGDTSNKDLYIDTKSLNTLGIPMNEHNKLPDVVLYDFKRNWLFLIEAVTSHGPVSPKRVFELEEMLKNCKTAKVYVSAFPDFKVFKKHSSDIAWETEVWLMDFPEHMIHFNGDRFIGPR